MPTAEQLSRLLAYHEALASRALDGETMHVAAPDGCCCLDHARERIAELEAALEEIEWRDIGNGQEVCAYCDSWRSDGHHYECVLGKALKREECHE